MYNVIFYKAPTEDGIEIESVHCETMTSANKLFWRHRGMKTFYYHMPSLCSAISMFENCPNLTQVGFRFLVPVDAENKIYTYNYQQSDFNSLTHADRMFSNCKKLKKVDASFKSLVYASEMFCNSPELTSVTSQFNSLTIANSMFEGTKIENFILSSTSLVEANSMFKNATTFTTFNGELESLKYADSMFEGTILTTDWKTSMPNLISANYMFTGCNIPSFNALLSSLQSGDYMFTNTNLERFNSSLNNLITGDSMFSGCKLNAESIFFIVDSLPKHDDYVTEEVIINEESGEEETIRTYNHNLTIGVGFSDNQSNKQLISDECLFSSWDELNNSLIDKGWNITWQFNN